MRKLVIHGVHTTVLTGVEHTQLCLDEGEAWLLDTGTPKLYLFPVPAIRELFIMAGYEEKKIDYAVPQAWYEDQLARHSRHSTEAHPRDFVWYYGGEKTLFGEPISIQTARWQLRIVVLRMVIETDTPLHSASELLGLPMGVGF